jgi:CTP:molybdopterin cytidylyltransferase MocA/NifU-like protein involved in Fe-S cluster formation
VTQAYSSVVLEHFRRPRNRGRLTNANATAEGTNPLCGDRIRIECEVADRRIVDAAFSGDACAICVAAASVLLERAKAMTVQSVMLIGDDDIAAWLAGPIPPTRRRCATLPLDTLHRALAHLVPVSRVRPVVLGAGAGRRFGGDKLVAIVDGEPMIRRVVRAYAALCGRVTVVARSSGQFDDALDGLPVDIVVNPHADEGMATSIRAGVTACCDRPALMFVLADDRPLVVSVMKQWEDGSAPIVVPRFGGVVGHPVLFDRRCFADLLALDGDVGARGIICEMHDEVRYVDVDRSEPVDIDTPDDLRKL